MKEKKLSKQLDKLAKLDRAKSSPTKDATTQLPQLSSTNDNGQPFRTGKTAHLPDY